MRICLYGGPAIGKSTLALELVAKLKKEFEAVELVDEFVKKWAYQGRRPTGFDQIYIFGCQLHKEDLLLKNGVKIIVTDSPVLLQCCYMNDLEYQLEMIKLSQTFDKTYDTFNIVLTRQFGFTDLGRIHSEEQSKKKDNYIRDIVVEYSRIDFVYDRNFDELYECLKSKLIQEKYKLNHET